MDMDLNLKNKVIIVTGGAKGIGLGIAKVLSAEGAIPFIIGRNKEDNLKAIEEIQLKGGKAFQTVAELTKADACEQAVTAIMKQCGRSDGLVNNAGVNDGVNLEHGSYE